MISVMTSFPCSFNSRAFCVIATVGEAFILDKEVDTMDIFNKLGPK